MGMKGWERWAPVTGILFVLAYVVAYFIAGELPKADDSAGAIRGFYADDTAVLTATYIFGLALVLYLAYMGTLASRLREGGQPRLAAVAFAGAIMIAAIQLIATVIHAALAYRTPADDGVLQALYDVQLFASLLVAFPAALLVGATAVAAERMGLFPRWFNALTMLAGVSFLVGGGAYASDGFFAPGGTYAMITIAAFMAWAVGSSAMLTMQAQAAEAPRPAAAAM
jgi:hypothetical protein